MFRSYGAENINVPVELWRYVMHIPSSQVSPCLLSNANVVSWDPCTIAVRVAPCYL